MYALQEFLVDGREGDNVSFTNGGAFDDVNVDEDNNDEPESEYFNHPQRGKLQTTLFENNKHTRLYFDDESGEWHRMPLSWERNLPSVQAMLVRIDAALPAWQNVNEQV
jgi:hypothetical protein